MVHHLIASKILPLLEQQFINDSYSTREGKGTLFGINRIAEQLREVSCNYTEDCYIMRLDIQGFFMSIIKKTLCDIIEGFVKLHYKGNDRDILLYLIRLTVMNRPEVNCIRKSPLREWMGLVSSKSLFGGNGTQGLPIGNLTSQLLALLYLDPMDHLVTEEWGIGGYGRYVDDMVLIDRSKEKLLAVKARIEEWLRERGLRLHKRKVYLQHYRKGVLFVGGMINPGYVLMGHRSIGFAVDCVNHYNALALKEGVSRELAEHFRDSLNSYFGLMQQYNAWHIAHMLTLMVHHLWFQELMIVSKRDGYKVVMRKK